MKIIESKPDIRKVHWYWCAEGGSGKTTFSKYLMWHFNAVKIDKGKYSDIMNIMFNAVEKRTVIIDIPRSRYNNIDYDAIESLKSGIVVNTKYETGTQLIKCPHIIVFANAEPDKEMLSADRWHIVNIDKDENSKLLL